MIGRSVMVSDWILDSDSCTRLVSGGISSRLFNRLSGSIPVHHTNSHMTGNDIQ